MTISITFEAHGETYRLIDAGLEEAERFTALVVAHDELDKYRAGDVSPVAEGEPTT